MAPQASARNHDCRGKLKVALRRVQAIESLARFGRAQRMAAEQMAGDDMNWKL
jgi:hypothetical protein